MSDHIKKDAIICNTRTNETGIVRGWWFNIAGQLVVNVRIGSRMASWNVSAVSHA